MISSTTARFVATTLPLGALSAAAVVLANGHAGHVFYVYVGNLLSQRFDPAVGALVALLLFLAGLLSGLSGFAFSAVAACVLWVLPPLQAIPLLMLLSTCNQLISAGSLRKEIVLLPTSERDGALPFILGGLAGVPAGLALLKGLPCTGFAAALGAFLIAYSVLMLCKPASLRISLSGWRPAMLVGAAGGVVGGFSGFPGSMPVVYLGLRGVGKTEMRGVVQPYILTLQLVSLAILALTDSSIFNATFWALGCVTLPAALLGTFTGIALYRRLSDVNFRRAVLILLVVSGVSLVARAIV